MSETIPISEVVWKPAIYPRAKWSGAVVDRYVEALEAGAEFPPITLEKGTNILLDGKHRLEAFKKAERDTIPAVEVEIPESKLTEQAEEILKQAADIEDPEQQKSQREKAKQMLLIAARSFAATLSVTHGERLSNPDLQVLAQAEAAVDPKAFDLKAWSQKMAITRRTLNNWVGGILSKEREERKAKVLRLEKLGWQQSEMADLLGVSQPTISVDIKKGNSSKTNILALKKDGFDNDELVKRFALSPTTIQAIILEGKTDIERMESLGISIRPWDVWNFAECHPLMGTEHPGRIPGELVCNALYFYTEQGDLVVDPMAGGGTVLDACLLMGRKCRGYDLDLRYDRVDIQKHHMDHGWPQTTSEADLIFWDPPYYKKKDSEYIEGSVSNLDRAEYLEWFANRFQELGDIAKEGAVLAFLMSNWRQFYDLTEPEVEGIFQHNYGTALESYGWKVMVEIQCPLGSQQLAAHQIVDFKEKKKVYGLSRFMLICKKEDE